MTPYDIDSAALRISILINDIQNIFKRQDPKTAPSRVVTFD